jgi:hypothetical protein
MLSRRPQIVDVLKSGTGIRSRTSRLLAALGFVAISPEIADAARRNGRRNGNQGRNNDEAQSNQDARADKTQTEQESDGKNGSKASAQGEDTGEKSGKAGKHNRNEGQTGSDESSDQSRSGDEKSSGDTKQRSSDSSSSSDETSTADETSHHHGGRRIQEFAQGADGPTHDASVDHALHQSSANLADPGVFLDHVPDASIADVVAQSSDDVVAGVSSSGGFAFARSGDVIAVSGPDGASIVQSGDVIAGTRGTSPVEPPDDGGNNNPDYFS